MPESLHETAENLFFELLELPAAARECVLQARCGQNNELRRLVTELLAADQAAGGIRFLESGLLDGAEKLRVPGDSNSLAGAETTEATSSPRSDGLSRDERFQVLSFYDKGGLGEVLIARDRQLNRDVAIKQIRTKWLGNEEARERFRQEAEVTGRLEHPGIVPVYAMGVGDDGRPFYAMRFIHGTTLKQVIADIRESGKHRDAMVKRMDLRGLLNRFIDVCNTIEYAHNRRILHRDIKPSNIMVGHYGETLVVDWGLAKLLDAPWSESMTANFAERYLSESDSSQQRIRGAIGTPQYMSPEQASGDLPNIDTRTDVYLLGATLYQILTGVPPHDESSLEALIQRVTRGIVTRPRVIDPDVPSALEAICMKAMSARPADRYRSAADLSTEIERWLADQPVSVYRDPVSVRMARWTRLHRTLAMSLTVAAVLITIGSVLGSTFWSYQTARQMQVEQERNLTAMQLTVSRQRRLTELRDSAIASRELAHREIAAGRFSTAIGVLEGAAGLVVDEPSLNDQHQELTEQSLRLRKIDAFYHNAELSEQFNVSSRDTQGILAATAALKSLGIWNHVDWWNRLPDQDLTSRQKDHLKWDAYQQWLLLDGMLVKTIGTRLFGVNQSGSTIRILSALRRMQSETGKREAVAVLVTSDRIDGFRQSEAAKWYRSIAHFRLGSGRRLKANELDTPRSAADSQKLGVLCLLSAMDPSFGVVFRDYRGQDAVTAGHDLFQRSASLRPDHYWTLISLGQMQYFIAEQESQPTWESYLPAIQTMGRCIAINPDSCFAYADRSSLFRFQWARMQADSQLPSEMRAERASELLKWSLEDAQAAFRRGADQPWVGWTYGMALSAADQTDQAVEILMETSKLTYPLMNLGDATLVRSDDLRGRSAASHYVRRLIEMDPTNSLHHTLLASISLNQQKYDEAFAQITTAIDHPSPPAHAYAVRGMIRLSRDESDDAADDFRVVLESDPDHLWGNFGLAVCDETRGQYQAAIAGYQRAADLSESAEHRSACLLGVGRCAGFLGRWDEAAQSITEAQQLQPACDLESVARPLLQRLNELGSDRTADPTREGLRTLLTSLGRLIQETRVEFSEPSASTSELSSYDAPVLNGDFELGSLRYWADQSGSSWHNHDGYRGTVQIATSSRSVGDFSLRIVGDDVRNDMAFGCTSQAFPVPANRRCRLSVWARAKDLGSGAMRLTVPSHADLEFPAGSYDWRELAMEFPVGDASDPFVTVATLTLKLVSSGPGDVFLDDVRVTVLAE